MQFNYRNSHRDVYTMKFLSFLSLAAGVSAATLQQQSHEKRSDTEIAARAVDKPYVFATFTSKNEQKSNEETWLHIYTSDDGKQFAEYAMNAYKPSKSLLRDPSIIKDGDTYYIAHTTGWDGDDFAVIKSKDLKNWENVATVKTGVKDTEKTWAPVCINTASNFISILAPQLTTSILGMVQGPERWSSLYLCVHQDEARRVRAVYLHRQRWSDILRSRREARRLQLRQRCWPAPH